MTVLEGQVKEMQIQMASLKAKVNTKFDLLMAKLDERPSLTRPLYSSRTYDQDEGTSKPLYFAPEFEFPKFNGQNPNEWIRKCNKYFDLCKIPDDQKVDFASLHMTNKQPHRLLVTWLYNHWLLGLSFEKL
ncbi:unnamed protein product [Amaranthus hypochondriacus]